MLRVPKTFLSFVVMSCAACSSSGSGTAAQQRGVGSACTTAADCTEKGQACLPFKGGYCGIEGCKANADCPAGSACVKHTDGKNYCFLLCADKPDCNVNRTPANEANCSSTATFVEAATGKKACVPPSGV